MVPEPQVSTPVARFLLWAADLFHIWTFTHYMWANCQEPKLDLWVYPLPFQNACSQPSRISQPMGLKICFFPMAIPLFYISSTCQGIVQHLSIALPHVHITPCGLTEVVRWNMTYPGNLPIICILNVLITHFFSHSVIYHVYVC